MIWDVDFLESVLYLFMCGFSSMILSVTRKNPQAYYRMARIFDAVSGKICRKDVWKKIRNRLLGTVTTKSAPF